MEGMEAVVVMLAVEGKLVVVVEEGEEQENIMENKRRRLQWEVWC